MRKTKLKNYLAALVVVGLSWCHSLAQNVNFDANNSINTYADQVGIWVNSNKDTYNTGYVNALQDLNMKSIRHGWQYSVMDENNPDHFYRSPCDSKIQPYVGDGNCNLVETLPLSDVASVAGDLGVPGFAVVGMDGINYTGNEDATLVGMTKAQREDFYIANAERWAHWAKNNNFEYFELGNESDLITGEMVHEGVGTVWDPEEYGAFAKRMAQAIKAIYPQAKCGINGGWDSTAVLREIWWDGILTGAPDINNWIDFVVIHKYEFGTYYNTYRDNMWDYGRIQPDNYTQINQNFPGKPVYLTETSGFQPEGGYVPAYRGIMTVEMMANALLDSDLEHMHHWGTRWEDDLVLDAYNNSYNMVGRALKSYTDFMKPVMVANSTVGSIRYFAQKDPADNSITVWLINHAETTESASVNISNFAAGSTGDVWRLNCVGDNPYAGDVTYGQDGTVSASNGSFSVSLAPVSVTVVSFDAGGSNPPSGGGNIALNKSASQNSIYAGGSAGLAVDGNTDGNYTNGSVTHTGCGSNDWWRVDLGANYNVGDIKIFNRTDCCADRLEDYNVKVLNGSLSQVWSSFQDSPAGSPSIINAGGATGRYVEIQKTTSGCLNIAEVEVYEASGSAPTNQAPTVGLTAPANNANFTSGGNVTITATASDSDGSVTKVEFYQGATKLGEDTTAPYSVTWNNVGQGSYSITAVATDDDSDQTTSAARNITVSAPSGGGSTLTVRAKLLFGSSDNLELRLDDTTVKTWTVTSSYYSDFTYQMSGSANVKVYFPDNGTDMAIDYIILGGTTYQAEAQATNTGAWQNGSCGGSYTENMYCSGYIDFGTLSAGGATPPPSSGEITSSSWVATAYSTFSGYPASNMIDSNNSSRWVSGASINNGSWVQLDMLSSQTVNQVIVTSANTNFPNNFAIYVSNTSGSGGTQVASGAGSTIIDESFSNTAGRYVRIVSTSAKGDWWDIYDIQVFGLTSGARFNAGEVASELKNEMSIYPNPVKQSFSIEGIESATLKVYDLSGAMVLSQKSITADQSVDIAMLRPGVYFVHVDELNGRHSKIKIVKQ